MRASRLGDDIDDFCVKCKRVMNHAVVSLMGDEPAKVRCRTCHSDHDFRHELPPPPKVDPRKAALFNQVLEKVAVPGSEAAGSEAVASETAGSETDAAAAAETAPESLDAPPLETVVETSEPVKAAPVKAARGRAKKV